jgi:RHS repeat-associated protein
MWKYTYDKNGNAIAEQVPGSSGPVTDALYTTTTAYDDLDRPLSRVIGQRALSAVDQAAFASATEKFTWDVGPNHTGFLRYWQSYAPGVTTAAITLDLANDNQGHRITTTHTLNIAGYTNLIRQSRSSYFLFGGLRTATYGDAMVAGGNGTSATYAYDARFLPSQLTLSRGGAPNESLAIQTRNVAGHVTKRRTNTTGAMTFVESNWTYDKLGRVADQVVQKGPGTTQVVRQSLAYFGNDDPSSLTHYLGTAGKKLDYGYDQRHQLATVSSTTAGYFSGTYAYGAAGRFARATEAQTINPLPPGTELRPRDVNYVYGGIDPEQITSLTNATGGATYASYTYDAAGNQLTRAYPPTNESWDYLYDGKDQLRRAAKKLGAVVQGSEEYWYDEGGQRIAIVKRDAAGAKTELITFTGDTEAHYTAAGALTRVYSHLSLGTPVARVERTSNTATSVEYQFHGLASNTIAAVAQTGTVNASFAYAPFGAVLETTNAGGATSGTIAHRRRFTDKHQDTISELSYYGWRYYDNGSLTWTQADPFYRFEPDFERTAPRRASLYTFNLNNALRYVDPDGRAPADEVWRQGVQLVNQAPHPAAKVVILVGVGLAVAAAALAETELGRPIDLEELARETARQSPPPRTFDPVPPFGNRESPPFPESHPNRRRTTRFSRILQMRPTTRIAIPRGRSHGSPIFRRDPRSPRRTRRTRRTRSTQPHCAGMASGAIESVRCYRGSLLARIASNRCFKVTAGWNA